jgi:hypothetical protein
LPAPQLPLFQRVSRQFIAKDQHRRPDGCGGMARVSCGCGGWDRMKPGKIGNIFLQNACIFTLIP